MKFTLVNAQLAIESGPAARIGTERVALLEAIRDQGSISAGARAVGIGFRAAWDAVSTLNNLFPSPLVVGHAGGRDGGGARLTPEGEEVVAAFRAVEFSLRRAVSQVAQSYADMDQNTLEQYLWSMNMRTSARNALGGVVSHIEHGVVEAEITLRVADDVEVVAVITERSTRELGLDIGVQAVALIKSSFVILAREDNIGRTSARNRFAGIIVAREDTEVNSEIILDLGNGKSLAAIITRTSADALALMVGDRACALIKSSHVILAVP